MCSIFCTRGQVKSIIRLPCRSHPTTKTFIAASKPSAETICSGLSHLAEKYKRMGDLILTSSTNRSLISSDQTKKWVEEVMEEYVNFLDVCGNTKDMVTQFKEHIRDLLSALRRRKCENGIKKYNHFRKKMKKDGKLLIAGLKQVNNMISGSSGSVVVGSDNNHQLAKVVKEVTRVNEITVSVFESLFLYFSTPVSKPNRWKVMVSKVIHMGLVACEDQEEHNIMNAFENMDKGLMLQTLCKIGSSTQGEEDMQIAKCILEKQETQLGRIETSLECIFRRLIGTRASLLNIFSYRNLHD